jgi:UDP-3-O-[3-hydroxymyristoyl] glucosamine N-acyltransferase
VNASDLADQLGVALEGADRPLFGAAPLESASETDLSFAASAKSFAAAQSSAAGCLIAPPSYEPADGQSVIRAASPRAFFAQAISILYPPRALHPGVHPSSQLEDDVALASTAEIGPLSTIGRGSVIGPHTRLGPGCHVGRDVHIGSHCLVHAHSTIYDHTRIGDRVILHSGCVLGADGFGFAPSGGRWVKFPQVGRVEIEDDVEIGANSCVDRAALGRTRVGAGSKLDNMVHVGHNCDIGRNVVVAAQTGFSGGVTVGDGVIIGGQVGVGDKARIEAGVILGSGSGVLTSKIVRAGQPLWGTPARPLKEYLEQLALFARLPELFAEVKRLRKGVAEVEKEKP